MCAKLSDRYKSVRIYFKSARAPTKYLFNYKDLTVPS